MSHEFVGIDWGTSSFRLWVMDARGDVLAERAEPRGMATMQRADYAPFLEGHLRSFGLPATLPVVICGMAGAAQGWHEAPYREIGGTGGSLASHAVRMDMDRPVWILPGLKQTDPANVMRGEETQIEGFLSSNAHHTGRLCLPGTHSKWVDIDDGVVTGFRTAMTGEVFSLLAKGSILRFSVDAQGTDPAAFDAGVQEALRCSGATAFAFFQLRAESLLREMDSSSAGSRLSGLLIGAEIASVAMQPQGKPVQLIGAPMLTSLYARALELAGQQSQVHDADILTRRGLWAAFHALERSCVG